MNWHTISDGKAQQARVWTPTGAKGRQDRLTLYVVVSEAPAAQGATWHRIIGDSPDYRLGIRAKTTFATEAEAKDKAAISAAAEEIFRAMIDAHNAGGLPGQMKPDRWTFGGLGF